MSNKIHGRVAWLLDTNTITKVWFWKSMAKLHLVLSVNSCSSSRHNFCPEYWHVSPCVLSWLFASVFQPIFPHIDFIRSVYRHTSVNLNLNTGESLRKFSKDNRSWNFSDIRSVPTPMIQFFSGHVFFPSAYPQSAVNSQQACWCRSYPKIWNSKFNHALAHRAQIPAEPRHSSNELRRHGAKNDSCGCAMKSRIRGRNKLSGDEMRETLRKSRAHHLFCSHRRRRELLEVSRTHTRVSLKRDVCPRDCRKLQLS